MGKHLVFAGGGHAHLTAISKLESFAKMGHRISVISPADYHYYSGMGPGVISGIYRPRDIRFNIRKLVESQGGGFVKGKVLKVVPEKRELILADKSTINYDIVSFNTGSEIPKGPFVEEHENIFSVKPIENYVKARKQIIDLSCRSHVNIAVVGGGAAGVEISGNIRRLANELTANVNITLISGTKILPRFVPKVRKLALDSLLSRNIRVIEEVQVDNVKDNRAELKNGEIVPFDIAFNAVGIKPSSIFVNSEVPKGSDGGLLVNKYLQSVEFPEIFGGGDAIYFEHMKLDKVGVYAVRQNNILLNNLRAILGYGKMREFVPQKKYLSILNTGDNRGILFRGSFVYEGKLAFKIKNHIDQSFMKKFQQCGERYEED